MKQPECLLLNLIRKDVFLGVMAGVMMENSPLSGLGAVCFGLHVANIGLHVARDLPVESLGIWIADLFVFVNLDLDSTRDRALSCKEHCPSST